jgi:hypothetical protein
MLRRSAEGRLNAWVAWNLRSDAEGARPIFHCDGVELGVFGGEPVGHGWAALTVSAASLGLRAALGRAIAQHPIDFIGEMLAAIGRERGEAFPDVPVDGLPIVAMALCRFMADGGKSDQLDLRLGTTVHI